MIEKLINWLKFVKSKSSERIHLWVKSFNEKIITNPRLQRERMATTMGLKRSSFLLRNFLTIANIVQTVVVIFLFLVLWYLWSLPLDLTTVTALGTICYAILTWVLISQTVQASRLQLTPDISFGVNIIGNNPAIYLQNYSDNAAKHLEIDVGIREKKGFWGTLFGVWSLRSYFSNELLPRSKKECDIMEQFLYETKTSVVRDNSGLNIITVEKGKPTTFEVIVLCGYCTVAGNFAGWNKQIYTLNIEREFIRLMKRDDDFSDAPPNLW